MKLSTLCSVVFVAGQAIAQTKTGAASTAIAQLKYKTGQRVEFIDNGKWYKAIVIDIRDDSADHLDGKMYAPYRVHPLGDIGYTDTWVCCADFGDRRSQLRAPGAGPTEPVPGGEANDDVVRKLNGTIPARPPAQQYLCSYSINGHSQGSTPFTITGDGTYADSEGKRGTYTFIAVSSTLTFHGGNYDGKQAEYYWYGGGPHVHFGVIVCG